MFTDCLTSGVYDLRDKQKAEKPAEAARDFSGWFRFCRVVPSVNDFGWRAWTTGAGSK